MNAGYLRAFAALGLSVLPAAAMAQILTEDFNVRIAIVDECEIVSVEDLDFSSAGVLSADVDEEADISVACTDTTPFQLGLNQGLGAGATPSARLMTGPAGATIGYALFSNAGRTTNWGNTLLSDTVSSTGNGSAQVFTVYGRVVAQATPAPGTYTDTITVTLTY